MRDLLVIGVMLALIALTLARPFVGVLAWSWISFMNPHQLSWGLASGLPWAALAFIATVAGCVLAREPRRLQLDGVMVLLLLLILGITLTSFAALGPPGDVWYSWERTLKTILGLLITAALLDERRRVHALVWLMVLSIGYFGVRGGLFTLVTGGQFIVLGPRNTMIADRNHLAVALLMTVPLMYYLRQQSPSHYVRWGLVGAMVLTVFAVIGSQSRGALVALLAAAIVLWLRTPGKLISGTAIAVSVAAAITFMPDKWVERMRGMEHFEADASAMGRITIWQAAFDVAAARPLTGGGFRAVYNQPIVDEFSPGVRARATHSIWFEVLGDHGFPTFFVWVGIFVMGIFYAWRIIRMGRHRPELRWAVDLARMGQVSIAAFAVGGTFVSLSYWDFALTLPVLLAATHRLCRQSIGAAAPTPTMAAAALPSAPPGRRPVPARRGTAFP